MDEKLIKILNDLEKYFADLEKLNIKHLEELRILEKYYAVSMILFSLLNRVIDLGQEVVISKKFGMPASYKEIFRILFERKILNRNLFKELEKFVDLRNMLSHEYYRIAEVDIFDAIKRAGILKEFISKMKAKLK